MDLSVNQIEFSLTQNKAMYDGSLDQMILKNIKPMAWSPLGSIYKESSEQTTRIKKQLSILSKKYNVTEDQLLLAWVLKHPSKIIPVIGSTDILRIKNALNATTIQLELEDWFLLLQASHGHEVP
jgi:predicted oxidoreductase